jgi:hypothetical protein
MWVAISLLGRVLAYRRHRYSCSLRGDCTAPATATAQHRTRDSNATSASAATSGTATATAQHRTSILPSLGQSETGGLASPRSQAHEDGTGERRSPSRASGSRAPVFEGKAHATLVTRPRDNSPEPLPDAICWRPKPSSVRATARTCLAVRSPAVGEAWGRLRLPGSEPADDSPGDDQ